MQSDGKLPAGWELRQLQDLALINPEQWPEDTPSNLELSYVDLAAVDGPGAQFEPTFIQFGEAPSRARRKAKIGDILVATVRPYLRGFTRIREESPNLTVSTGYAVIRSKDKTSGEFLYQHVLSDEFIQWLSPRMTGTNYPAVNADDIVSYPLPCPPPEIRRRIGNVLNSIDSVIGATQAVIEQTRRLKIALLQDLMTNGLPGRHANSKRHKLVGRIPEAWQVKPLLEVAKVIDCKHRTPIYQKDGFPVVRPSDVKEGKLDLSKSPRTSEEEFEDLIEKYCPKRGDIVYSRNASFGVAAYADTDEPFTIGQDVVIITSETASNRYLFYLLNSEIFKRQLNRLSAGSTFQRVNLEDIRQYAIALPPQQEQDEIAAILSQVDERIEAEEDHLEQLQSVRVALSQGLLTGRIPVTATAKEVL